MSADEWQTSPLGTPGIEESIETPIIRINEVSTNSEPPDLDAIELTNTSDTSVDISGWFLTDSLKEPRQFAIPDGAVLNAGTFMVFREDAFANFALSSGGDDVYLLETDNMGRFNGTMDHLRFGAAPVGVTYGLTKNSLGEESVSLLNTSSLGEANSAPKIGPLVITEFMAHPSEGEDEFVEILNTGSMSVTLTNVRINGTGYTFTEGTLPPRGLLVLTSGDPLAFRQRHAIPEAVQIVGPFPARLDNSGERLTILIPDADEPALLIPSDQVRYQTMAPWPATDGNGLSLERNDLTKDGNDPLHWVALAQSAGFQESAENPEPQPTGDDWKVVYFSEAELLEASTSGDLADPDADGLPNMAEYAFGRNPRDRADGHGLLNAEYVNFEGIQTLRIQYISLAELPFHRIETETSSDLIDWQNGEGQFQSETITALPNGRQQQSLVWSAPRLDEEIYVRLKVVRLP